MIVQKDEKILSLGKSLSLYEDTDTDYIAGLFPRGYMSLVASAPGTGKTWFTLYIACKISIKDENLFAGLAHGQKQTSVIMAGETGRKLLVKRLKATEWKYDINKIVVYDALEMLNANVPFTLNSPDGQKTLYQILNAYRPDILFFDTLISYHTCDESKQDQMTVIYQFLAKTAKIFDCAIVCNHHTRKRVSAHPDRKQTQDDVIGTSAGIRLASSVYILSRDNDDETEQTIVTVRNVKNWDKRLPPFSYKISETDNGYIDFDVNLNTDLHWNIRTRLDRIIAELPSGGLLQPIILAQTMGVSDTLVRTILDEYVNKKLLAKIKYGNGLAYGLRKGADDEL